jgi:hypothetical protein
MKTALKVLLIAFPLLLLASCSVGSSSSVSGKSTGGAGAAQSAPAKAPPAESGSAARGAPGSSSSSSSGPSGSSPQVGSNPAQLPEGTRVQRSAQLTLQVAHGRFDAAINRVLALVSAEGGFVAGTGPQPDESAADLRTGQITFQVPTAKFDDALVALRKMGQVRRFDVSGTDVSTQYVDLKSRLASAQAQRDAYLALLNRAQSIGDIVLLQNQLAPIVAQIEELEGQIDNLDRTTTYGTITATIQEALAPGASPGDGWGVASSLGQALHNFVSAVDIIVIVLGTIAPFLLLGGLGYLGWRTWDRRRRVLAAPGTNS